MKGRTRSLPLHGGWQAGSYATCTYKCNDDCRTDVPNEGAVHTFAEVAERAMSRRRMLQGAAVAGLVAGFAGLLDISAAERSLAQDGSQLGFTPVPPNTSDTVTVPAGYQWRTFIRWGDPILPGTRGGDESNVGLLWVNHEYTNPELMFAG